MSTNKDNETMRAEVLDVVCSNGGLDVGYSFTDIMVALNVEQDDFRDVDRALQSLRKKGLTTYSRKSGWLATEAGKKEVRRYRAARVAEEAKEAE